MTSIKDAVITNVSFSAKGKLKEKSTIKVTDEISLIFKNGIFFELSCSFNQTLNDLLKDNFASAEVGEIRLNTDSVFISHKEEEIIKLKEISIFRGGSVKINNFEPMNKVSNVEIVESAVMLIGFLMALSKSSYSNMQKRAFISQKPPNDFESILVRGLTLSALQTAISKGLIKLIKENNKIISGFDLAKAFGLK